MISILKNRDYFWLWVGHTVSQLGDSLRDWAMIFWVYRASDRSPLVISLSFIAVMLTNILVGPIAGVWVDRWDRRRVMIVSDLIRGALSLGMVASVMVNQYWYAIGLSFLAACAARFFGPARTAMIRRVVGPQRLLHANSLAQTTTSIMELAGPAIGTAIYAFAGAKLSFGLDAATFFLSALCIALVRSSGAIQASSARPAFLQELKVGLQFCWKNRTIRAILVSITVLMLGAGVINSMGVLMVQKVLGLPETALGYVAPLQAAASLVTVLAIGASIRKARRAPMLVALGMGIGAVGIGLIAGALNLVWLAAGTMAVGVANVVLNLGASTTMQMVVPDRMLGRVASVLSVPGSVAMVLSAAVAGVVALQVSPRWLLGFAAVVIGLAAVSAYLGLRGVVLEESPAAAAGTD